MAKYLAHSCPRCGDYLGIVVPETTESHEVKLAATCAVCGYDLHWRVLTGGESDEAKQ